MPTRPHRRTILAALAAGATLALAPLTMAGAAHAADDAAKGDHQPAACAQQQKQSDRAHAALDRLTAKFERQQAEVKKDKKEVRTAPEGKQRAEAKRELREDKADRDKTARAKKAQQQRVAKADARLQECQAAQG